MNTAILISICFSIGFFFESIFGFGGGLIAYSILGFFIDFKIAILAGLYIGTVCSIFIALTSLNNFDKKIFIKLIPISIIGNVIGILIFVKFPSEILGFIFGLLLILLAIKTIFFDKYNFPKIFKKKLILIGGISQGTFGVGGPFIANAIKNDFKNKSAFRSTLACYFLFGNFIRIFSLILSKNLDYKFLSSNWWMIIPVLLAVILGYKVHLKINDIYFKNGIAIITVIAALKFISDIFY